MNKNRLRKSKKLAVIQLKLDYASGMINVAKDLSNPDVNNWVALMKGEQLLRYYNGQSARIRHTTANPMDVLDITQIGNDYPIGINTNG